MEKLVIASFGKGAGKTSLIIGMAKVLKKPFGYLKPFGDRMIYREKKVWDYDADLVSSIFGIRESPEEMTIGFEHAKLRYIYDEEGRTKKLQDMVSSAGKEFLFIEGAEHLRYGVSVGLESISKDKAVGGKLLMVIPGSEDSLMDDALYVKEYLDMTGISFKGIIFNKVQNREDFKNIYLKQLTDRGIRILGIVPYEEELAYLTVNYLAKRLFAKIITGDNALNRVVKNILVGAMSVNALFQTPLFQREDKLVITPGDRADMILAAIESNAVCIVITNNILPTPNIISKAYERNIPLLLVPQDTYQTATQIDRIESLLTKDDASKIDLLGQMVQKYVNLKEMTQA